MSSTNARPNIVFLFSDQQRFDSIGHNGATVCLTPNIDALARGGTGFSRAYTVCPLCTPARASLLTGLYPHHHGALSNMGNFNGVFDQQVLSRRGYPQVLREAGYLVGYVGKWHLPEGGNRERWGFDRWPDGHGAALRAKGIDYNIARDEVQPLEWGAGAPFHGSSVLSEEDHHDAWVADCCIEMIADYAAGHAPFMVCGAFHGPHFPIAVPEPWHSMYDPKRVPRWDNFDEGFDGKPIAQQKEQLRWNASHLTWPDWQEVIAAYWGYCSFIDKQVGRVMAELDRLGLGENTVVIYTTDHGDLLGSHRMFNKGFVMYEECTHIPMIVRWPGVAAPAATCDRFVSLMDIMPTILEAAGCALPPGLDAMSLVPLLRGEDEPGRPMEALVEFHGYEPSLTSMRMVRTEKWKYVYNPTSTDELYDMESDPAELRNLADKLGFRHVLRRMKALMVSRLRAADDSIVAETPWQSASYDLFVSERER